MATINFLYRSNKERASLTLRLLYRFEGNDFVFAGDSKIIVTKSYYLNKKEIINGKEKIIISEFNTVYPERVNSDVLIDNQRRASIEKQSELKKKLSHIEAYIMDEFNKCNPIAVNKDWLKTQINNFHNPVTPAGALPNTLIEYIDHYLAEKKTSLKPNTVKKVNVIKQMIVKYESKLSNPILLLEVGSSFKTNFESYCLKEKFAPNTISTAFKYIRAACYHAQSEGLDISNTIKKVSSEYKAPKSMYLDFQELAKINNKDFYNLNPDEITDFEAEELENAKDFLIISSYTGQRISDFMRFSAEMVKVKDGNYFIEFIQTKTEKRMFIPLTKEVVDIFKKRNNQFPPKFTDQRYNIVLKEVCRLAGIDEMVEGSKMINNRKKFDLYPKYELCVSHMGRRNFCTNFYTDTDWLVEDIMFISGHKLESTLLDYIQVSDQKRAERMANKYK